MNYVCSSLVPRPQHSFAAFCTTNCSYHCSNTDLDHQLHSVQATVVWESGPWDYPNNSIPCFPFFDARHGHSHKLTTSHALWYYTVGIPFCSSHKRQSRTSKFDGKKTTQYCVLQVTWSQLLLRRWTSKSARRQNREKRHTDRHTNKTNTTRCTVNLIAHACQGLISSGYFMYRNMLLYCTWQRVTFFLTLMFTVCQDRLYLPYHKQVCKSLLAHVYNSAVNETILDCWLHQFLYIYTNGLTCMHSNNIKANVVR